MLYNLILSPETNCSHIRWLKMLKTKMFFSTASEAKREVKSLISIKTSMNSENMGHLWHKMSRIYLKKLRAPCQISSYFWVFWGKIQLSNGHKVSWFWVGWKILLDLIFPHVGLSSMPFWGQSEDPPTFMICGHISLESNLDRFLIPKIPKTDLRSSQIVESDGTLGISKTKNVPIFIHTL